MDILSPILQGLSLVGIAVVCGWLVSIGRQLQVLDDVKTTTEKIKYNVKVVSDYLIKHGGGKFNSAELRNYSPLQLTENGLAFVKNIGFEKVFEENRAEFFACIDGEHPKLKYDVESAAVKSIFLLNDKPFMNFLKVYLYNNPTRTLDDVSQTLGVYIRDKYLEGHPEIIE
jgi:hypothetical protein